MIEKILGTLRLLLAVSLLAIAVMALRHLVRPTVAAEVVASLRLVPGRRVALAALVTAVNYAVFSGYEWLAVRYAGERLSFRRAAFASFVSYGISQSLGMSPLTGGAVRWRLYSGWGVSPRAVARIVAFNLLSYWMGMAVLAGLLSLAVPVTRFSVVSVWQRLIGGVLLVLVAVYVGLCARRRPLRLRSLTLTPPEPRFALAGIAFGVIDWALAGSVLATMAGDVLSISIPRVLNAFLLAQLAGIASQVPGGIGIFESVSLLLLTRSGAASAPALAGRLIAYRALYYLVPLALALLAWLLRELQERGRALSRMAVAGLLVLWDFSPSIAAAGTFLAGAALVLTNAYPGGAAFGRLSHFIPDTLLELSRLLGSVAGAALLFLARGIQRRLAGAFHLTVVLLVVATLLGAARGHPPWHAAGVACLLALFVPLRARFYRRSSLFDDVFSLAWSVAISLVIIGGVSLTVFSRRHTAYSAQTLWQFLTTSDAPRALRASVAALATAMLLAWAKLMRPPPVRARVASPNDLARAERLIGAARDTLACLARLGDKAVLFSESGKSFLMFSVQGRSWICLGDPIGPGDEAAELLRRFRELCDEYDGWPVFYQVRPEWLFRYVDLGLRLVKIGETARVDLGAFSLEGHERKALRQIQRKFDRPPYRFELVAPADVPPILPALKVTSDLWLRAKETREKRFSNGYFSPSYLERSPIALLRDESHILAFCNVLMVVEELSIDLMRHRPDSPRGVMDYTLLQLLLWGRREGYRWFDFGVAPLSGFEQHRGAPAWTRIAHILFETERPYHFKGLRAYKEKFGPVWSPRYLAYPPGLNLPQVISDLIVLQSGGIKGVLGR
ncbi:bifunctional lysylphosphatidylglycerol flippase/synthetase MprF [Sorangium sp. So ce1097]|uniref:bifunctional lysylphosphatidylglycerol flippase/synthetase MprF n=1 Tax=Sorangium sp. So ce1097 TaxID=3133330 RepID=UPI003F628EA5